MSSADRPNRSQLAGVSRRIVLQSAAAGVLGTGMSAAVAENSQRLKSKKSANPKSIILVFLTGAASHHDTFDMKPDAPAEIRGEFNPIETSVPGINICEHLPHLAKQAEKFAIVRTLSHKDNNHLMSTHHVLTGTVQPGAFFDKVASRDDWPSYAAGSAFLQPRRDGIPSGVNLPTFLLQGPLTWPGQHAGFLGPKYDPWQITGDPQKPEFRVDSLTLAPGIDTLRLEKRQSLLNEINQLQHRMEKIAASGRMSDDQKLAFSILTSSGLTRAFDLKREADSQRDRYGRNTTGQSLLLARRLVQVGVPVVQVNVGGAQTWDNHGNIFPTLKDRLLPPLDQGVSALLDDLDSKGMLDQTMVITIGEFGRTPKINNKAGRDHWGPCFSALFAGGGVQGGQVIGKTDEIGAYPVTSAYSPDDVGATVYQALNIDAEAIVRDRLNRPARLNHGEIIRPLFSGASV